MKWDESQHFPLDLFKVAGEFGFMGILIPEEYGGAGLGYHEYIKIIDQISRVDPSIGLSVAAHNSLCTNHIYLFGNENQKCRSLVFRTPDLLNRIPLNMLQSLTSLAFIIDPQVLVYQWFKS